MKRLETDFPMKMNLQYFAEDDSADDPDGKPNDPETNSNPSDDPAGGNDDDKNAEIIKKLTARIGKEQGQKNDVQAKLDKAQEELEKLRKGNTDRPKPLTPEQEEVKQLKAQMARRDTVDETVNVFNESGVNVPKDIVEVLVTDDHDKTIDNATKLLGFITSIQKDTEDSVRKEYQAGKIPESTKHGNQSLSDLGKAVSQSTPSRQSLDKFE